MGCCDASAFIVTASRIFLADREPVFSLIIMLVRRPSDESLEPIIQVLLFGRANEVVRLFVLCCYQFFLLVTAKSHKLISSVMRLPFLFLLFSAASQRTMSSLNVVQEWMNLMEESKFEEAAMLVDENVVLKAPRALGVTSGTGRDNWLQGAPNAAKNGPAWGPPESGSHEHQFICTGTKKIGFLNAKAKRTVEFNPRGKITSITIAKA